MTRHTYTAIRHAAMLEFVGNFTRETGYGVTLGWLHLNCQAASVGPETIASDLCHLVALGRLGFKVERGCRYYWAGGVPASGNSTETPDDLQECQFPKPSCFTGK